LRTSGFDYAGMTVGESASLNRWFPGHAALIERFIRDKPGSGEDR